MNALAQESLLLRQLAALRRGGMPPDVAMAAASEGLPTGALRESAIAALAALRAGTTLPRHTGGTLALLARGSTTPEQLDHAAMAAEARLWAESALRASQSTLWAAGIAAILLGSVGHGVARGAMEAADATQAALGGPSSPLATVYASLCWTAQGLGVATLALHRPLTASLARFAPGRRATQTAAMLLDLAAGGTAGALDLDLLRPAEQTWFVNCRARTDAATAAAELAEELLREGQVTLGLFRQVAPMIGAALAFPLVVLVLTLGLFPTVFGTLGSVS